eukprot:TRINITY_DN9312_c1_g1_i2.p2 TRINITY_DN9312_c1_g1~~TRINITY_DN9312_c1_g1_i2.p2  ORF type:complete len:179 (+),score=40.46 TRINITY_DN9312_c1_g1_i2:1626-2162(+)
MMASTETYLSSLEQEAIDYAKELGRPTLSELNERFAAQHGIDSSSLYATPEKNEMHWSQEPAPSDEPMSTFMARQAFRVGFGLLYVVDVIGEYVASGIGITKPRYDAVLDDFIVEHYDELMARRARRDENGDFVQEADAMETGVEDLSKHVYGSDGTRSTSKAFSKSLISHDGPTTAL